MTPVQIVEVWNRSTRVGTKVNVRRDNGQVLETHTRSGAFIANNGRAVIQVAGISGYYLLDRVTVSEAVTHSSREPSQAETC